MGDGVSGKCKRSDIGSYDQSYANATKVKPSVYQPFPPCIPSSIPTLTTSSSHRARRDQPCALHQARSTKQARRPG
jgi:hypothetical protein